MNFSKPMTERRQRNLLIKQIAAWLFVNGFPYALITRSPKAFGHIWATVNGRELYIEVRIGRANLRRKRGERQLQAEPAAGRKLLVHSFAEFIEQIAPLYNLRYHKDR
ncbi:MAG: hypothetical protein MdMp024_1877 [Bacteroidales bacterium]